MYGNTIKIGRDNSGQVAIGETIHQNEVRSPDRSEEKIDLQLARQELQELLDRLNQKITVEAPAEKKAAALEHAGEIKETLLSGKPNLTTLEYVKDWFARNAPRVAGEVTGLFVHPIVGKLVEAAGDLVAAEFRRRFDPKPAGEG